MPERDNAIDTYDYISEGIACYVFDSNVPRTTPLYRLLNPNNGDHFYTVSVAEHDNAIATYGYTSEGVACYVFDSHTPGTSQFYRLLNPNNGDHFYTASASERDNVILGRKKIIKALWNRVHRFVRLWRKLGWTMRDLDKAITAFKPVINDGKHTTTNIEKSKNDDFLIQLSHIHRLKTNLNVPLVNIMSWYANIDTNTYIDQLADGQPEVTSLYQRLFRNNAVIKPLDTDFKEDATTPILLRL